MKVIGTNIVFKEKVDASGDVERYECCFVVQGYREMRDLNYTGMLTLTQAAATTTILLALASLSEMRLNDVDLDQAFIQVSVE